jgi:hypothetical protein
MDQLMGAMQDRKKASTSVWAVCPEHFKSKGNLTLTQEKWTTAMDNHFG